MKPCPAYLRSSSVSHCLRSIYFAFINSHIAYEIEIYANTVTVIRIALRAWDSDND